MDLDYSCIQFQNVELKTRQAVKLRGYFANIYKDNELIHHHTQDGLRYQYPKVQYKVLKGVPTLCGIQEGTNIVCQIGLETDELLIDNKKHGIIQKAIKKTNESFGLTEDYIPYHFVTPWMALNQKNIRRYEEANEIEREKILQKVLIGNILSLSKGVGYSVDGEIFVWINVKSCEVNFKNIRMQAFIGEFKTNFLIPDFLGLGKSVSRGLGTIKRS